MGLTKTYLSGVWNHSKVLMATGVPAVRGSNWYIQTTFVCAAASPCPNGTPDVLAAATDRPHCRAGRGAVWPWLGRLELKHSDRSLLLRNG